MKLKTRTETLIECSDWDAFVVDTYKRPYCFQQQDGCQSRGLFRFSVPYDDEINEDDYPSEIPEIVNGLEQVVKFSSWLARDPKQPLSGENDSRSIKLWWHRNFYPTFGSVVDDLHAKGLLAAGNYAINIDW